MNRPMPLTPNFSDSISQERDDDFATPSRLHGIAGEVLARGESLLVRTTFPRLNKMAVAPSLDQVARLAVVTLAVMCIVAVAKS